MKKNKVITGVVGITAIGYLFATPYITTYQIKNAVEKGNGEALSKHIDFPVLRQNMKDQMNVMLAEEMAKSYNPFAMFGAAFGGAVVENMVNQYVNPDSITALMKGYQPETEATNSDSTTKASPQSFPDTALSYKSFNEFQISIKDAVSGEEVEFILVRKGLGWKLTNIILPIEAFY